MQLSGYYDSVFHKDGLMGSAWGYLWLAKIEVSENGSRGG